MNYIHSLQNENKELKDSLENINEELTDLLTYLCSNKFQNEDWVSAKEMYNRLIQLRMLTV